MCILIQGSIKSTISPWSYLRGKMLAFPPPEVFSCCRPLEYEIRKVKFQLKVHRQVINMVRGRDWRTAFLH